MNKERYFALVSLSLAISCMPGCGHTVKEPPASTQVSSAKTERSDHPLIQFSQLKVGDPIAMIKTNLGNITIRLFPDLAPKAVENFTSLAQEEYYNGVIFHRVIEGFMAQTGDPTGTGAGGKSIWGEHFEDEFSPDLCNFYGAVSMANSGPNTNSSQFFIVQAHNNIPSEETLLGLKGKASNSEESSNIISKYLEVGGTPWLDGKHTVFGHVIDGIDILEKIASVKTDASDKPLEAITIESIELSNFGDSTTPKEQSANG